MPDFLFRLKYAPTHVEEEFELVSNNRVIKPEMVMQSSLIKHVLFLESKQGPNVDQDQLQRYECICQDTLDDITGPFFTGYRHDTMLNGRAENIPSLRNQMSTLESPLPLVSIGSDLVRLELNAFALSELNEALTVGVEINPAWVTTRIPCSSECGFPKIARLVANELIKLLVSGKEECSPSDFMRGVCRGSWELAGKEERKALLTKVSRILKIAQQDKFLGEIFQMEKDEEKKTQIKVLRKNFDAVKGNAKAQFLPRQQKKTKALIEYIEKEHW